MARPKASDKQDDAPPPPRTVSIDEFITTRDRVVNGLSSLQFAIASLLNAYLDHCKTLVGDAGVNVTAFNPAAPAAADAAFNAKVEKKKKVKKERDPDAPKRPLTAAFLYSQHARPVVKQDLEGELPAGEKLAPNAVNEEVNRRWNSLDEDSKQQWKDQYKKNLELYKVEAAEYEATKKAKADKDLADADDAEEDAVPGAAHVDSDADGSSDDETSVREPSSPPKAPTPPPASASKANKRRKTTRENGVAVSSGTEVPLPGLSSTRASAVPLPGASANASEKPAGKKASAKKSKAESPLATKSRARKSKADEEPSVVEPAPEPEKKTSKRKRKADA